MLRGRSRCDSCGATLAVRDLIPLVSDRLLGGKCRSCGAAIPAHHRWVELLAMIVGAAAFLVAPGWAGFAGAILGWLLLALATFDLMHFWLPDRLTALLAVGGIASGLAGLPPGLEDRLIGAAAGFTSLWMIAWAYRLVRDREGLGGGDPKLFGAIGAWLGWQALPAVLLGGTIIGLTYVLARLLLRQPLAATDRLPLGALLSFAAFAVWILVQ